MMRVPTQVLDAQEARVWTRRRAADG
jgi:hypothetical protein